MGLERREREHCPRLLAMTNVLGEQTFQEAEVYATQAPALAEKHGGIDRHRVTWEDFRWTRAYLADEPVPEEQKLARMYL